jgi:DNA polymerase III subunit gamma/tau
MFDDQLPSAMPKTEPHRALYLRWRPKRFEDVVGQEHVTRTLRNAVKTERLAHAYLLTGPRGTGKTSVARILYRAANCANTDDGDPCNTCALCRAALDGRALDLIEIDAASNRGIDDIRDLRERIAFSPGEGRFKVYIIDEAHELTPQAWDALLKTLEEPPPHAIIVLATTEAHKVQPTIVSRCQRFDFRRIPYDATRDQLARVARAEGMDVDTAVLERLALLARGGLRDAISLLDQLGAFAGGQVDMQVARAALSLPSIEAVRGVIDGLTRRDPAAVMALMADVAEGGADLRLFVDELVVNLRAVLLLRTGADARLTDELPADEVEWLRERAPAWSVGSLMRLLQTLSESLARTRDAQQFQVQAEVALLAACDVESAAALPVAAPARVAEPAPPIAAEPAPTLAASRTMAGPAEEAPPIAAEVLPPARRAVAARIAEPSPSARQAAEACTPPLATPPAGAPPVAAEPPMADDSASVAPPSDDHPAAAQDTLKSRWPDVVDHVRSRKPILGALLSSARPVATDGAVLTVAFETEFNKKRAEIGANRQAIEAGIEHALGRAYRLRCTVNGAGDGQPSLLEDPVINYAARTFGGQPRRVASEPGGPAEPPL